MNHSTARLKLGFIPAHRGFFSARLATAARTQTIETLSALDVEVVVPTPQQTKLGCVESLADAEVTAALFREVEVAGIVIGAMNFGDEQGAALAVKLSRLNVPVFIFGAQEEATLTPKAERRDAFCGLLSIADALRQCGIVYTIGQRPIAPPGDPRLRADLDCFVRVCRVVHGIRHARYGQIGARPDAFWTCRYDEAALQKLGPTTVTLDLSEALARSTSLADDAEIVRAALAGQRAAADTSAVAALNLLKIAKFEAFLRQWAAERKLDALAIQCWTSLQQNLGICACSAMSRLSDLGIPAACESDILGALSMHALRLATDGPSALADWNNLHNDDDDLVNLWHCGVFPASFGQEKPRLGTHGILPVAGACAPEQAQGVIELVMKETPLTLFRLAHSTGTGWHALAVEGRIEDNSARTFGSYGWCRIPQLQSLYRDVLLRHFPHHVALAPGHFAEVLREAFGRYLNVTLKP